MTLVTRDVIRRPGNRWAYVCDLPSETGTPLTLLSIESENGHTSMALFIKRGVPFLIFHAFSRSLQSQTALKVMLCTPGIATVL